MTDSAPKNEGVFFRVDPTSGRISTSDIPNHFPTHAAALTASREILACRRLELQNELASIDAMLSAR